LIKCYYEPKLCQASDDYAILGWESQEAHALRFQVFFDSVELSGKSILDVGCGLGNLYGFLESRGISFDYLGADILPEMILKAVQHYPKARFIHADVFSDPSIKDGSFDVVSSSGIFNLNLGNNHEFLSMAFARLIRIARESVVFNLLHTRSTDKDEKTYFYFHPDEVMEIIAPSLPEGTSVRIVEEYLPNDFTVVCTKNPPVTPSIPA
jgi:SAM-dependent methyltransferase